MGELSIAHDVATDYCDNLSANCSVKDQVNHDRTKHMNVRYHFLRTNKRLKVKNIRTANNPTDFFIKFVPFSNFKHCLDLLNIDYYVA